MKSNGSQAAPCFKNEIFTWELVKGFSKFQILPTSYLRLRVYLHQVGQARYTQESMNNEAFKAWFGC
jgi:hypothetical protein